MHVRALCKAVLLSPRRVSPSGALVLAAAAATWAAACSNASSNGTTGPSGGAIDADGGLASAVASITVSPASATLTLEPQGDGFRAAGQFTAMATLKDGSSRDVTAEAVWSTDETGGSVNAGALRATAPGALPVVARIGDVTGRATARVRLATTLVVGGVDGGLAKKIDTATAPGSTSIAYPLDGALFPTNVSPVTVHVRKTAPGKGLVRLRIEASDLVALNVVAPCAPGPNDATACYVDLPPALPALLAAVSETDDLALSARVASDTADVVADAKPVTVGFAKTRLSGGLYYWSSMPTPRGDETTILRYDFSSASGGVTVPEVAFSERGVPASHREPSACIGCHAISRDGSKLAVAIGGSFPGDYALVDIASQRRIATKLEEFATFTAFGPDSQRLVTMYRGELTLRPADESLAVLGPVLTSVREKKTDPFWSAGGKYFAFTTWVPGQNGAPAPTDPGDRGKLALDGDLKWGGQIWIADAKPDGIADQARVLVPRENGVTSYYPAVSDDEAFVLFNRSSCSGTANAKYNGMTSSCAGYDDPSARLYLVRPEGGPFVELARANGKGDLTSSWPRWAPDRGTFRGKTLYFFAFSSRRPYGLAQVGDGGVVKKPQLWFAALAVDGQGTLAGDPSFAPVWLPGQNTDPTKPGGNHVPQWVTRAVPILR